MRQSNTQWQRSATAGWPLTCSARWPAMARPDRHSRLHRPSTESARPPWRRWQSRV